MPVLVDDPKLDAEQVNAAVTGFEVISLKDALADADAAGRHLKLDTLPPPTDKSMAPVPPLAPPVVPSKN